MMNVTSEHRAGGDVLAIPGVQQQLAVLLGQARARREAERGRDSAGGAHPAAPVLSRHEVEQILTHPRGTGVDGEQAAGSR